MVQNKQLFDRIGKLLTDKVLAAKTIILRASEALTIFRSFILILECY